MKPKDTLTIVNSETKIDVTEFANKDVVALHARGEGRLTRAHYVRSGGCVTPQKGRREKRGRGLLAAPL